MITLFRWIRLCQLRVKWKLTLYTILDKIASDAQTGELKDKVMKEILPLLVKTAQEKASEEKNKAV